VELGNEAHIGAPFGDLDKVAHHVKERNVWSREPADFVRNQ
jgi:hypothetical protein